MHFIYAFGAVMNSLRCILCCAFIAFDTRESQRWNRSHSRDPKRNGLALFGCRNGRPVEFERLRRQAVSCVCCVAPQNHLSVHSLRRCRRRRRRCVQCINRVACLCVCMILYVCLDLNNCSTSAFVVIIVVWFSDNNCLNTKMQTTVRLRNVLRKRRRKAQSWLFSTE